MRRGSITGRRLAAVAAGVPGRASFTVEPAPGIAQVVAAPAAADAEHTVPGGSWTRTTAPLRLPAGGLAVALVGSVLVRIGVRRRVRRALDPVTADAAAVPQEGARRKIRSPLPLAVAT